MGLEDETKKIMCSTLIQYSTEIEHMWYYVTESNKKKVEGETVSSASSTDR